MQTPVLVVLAAMLTWAAVRAARPALATGGQSFTLTPQMVGIGAALVIGGLACATGIQAAAKTLVPVEPAPGTADVIGRDIDKGNEFGVDEGFMQWIDATIPKEARIYTTCEQTCDAGRFSWTAARLEPRKTAPVPSAADWVIFIKGDPGNYPYVSLDRVVPYADGLSIAHVSGGR